MFPHLTLFSLEESWEGRDGAANSRAGMKAFDRKGHGSAETHPGRVVLFVTQDSTGSAKVFNGRKF